MNSAEGALLRHGVRGNTGRLTPNKTTNAKRILGDDRVSSLIEMHWDIANNCEKIEQKVSAQQFLLNKLFPNARSNTVKIELKRVECIQDISDNENIVMASICAGEMTLDEGDRLFQLLQQKRATHEAMDVVEQVKLLHQRMKDAGLIT